MKKKQVTQAEKDGVRDNHPPGEQAASTKAKRTKAKQTNAKQTKAKQTKAKQTKAKAVKVSEKLKAPKKPDNSVIRNSKVTANSEKQGKTVGRDTAEQNDAGEMKRQELDPFAIAKQKLKGSVPAIVDAMVKLAKQGSCPHAKTLLEISGAKHMFDSDGEAQGSGEPWAKLVLERLDEAEFKAEQETIRAQKESLRGIAE